jgi:SAM-dependent methyltransferase
MMNTHFVYAERKGVIDNIVGHPLPVLRCIGWFDGDDDLPLKLSTTTGAILVPSVIYRYWREDAVEANVTQNPFAGFVADFFLGDQEYPVTLSLDDVIVAIDRPDAYATVVPYYALFQTPRVLHREDIYGQGLPTDVCDEVKAFSLSLSGKVLDFGCGNGDMVAWLKNKKMEAVGLELNTERVLNNLKDEVREFVLTYEGGVPLPFGAGEFDSVFSTEVIEHIPDVENYIPEFHRVLKPGGRMLITTPDMGGIPSSYSTGTVPWHILESTHVNFFNYKNLETLFGAHFVVERYYTFGQNWVNGSFVAGSIGLIMRRKELPRPALAVKQDENLFKRLLFAIRRSWWRV